MSQITTHVLDTTSGKTAPGIAVTLYHYHAHAWTEVAEGLTNMDGRISDLLPPDLELEHGMYKMKFETRFYFQQLSVATFYPFVEIVFDIEESKHYHIPLLISPFGYTTYRGS